MIAALLLQAAAVDVPDSAFSAEKAIARQRAQVHAAIRQCPDSSASDEIVVCAARPERSPYRLPLPVEREPGTITRGRGDVPSGTDALRAAEGVCAAGPVPCGGGYIDFGRVAKVLFKLGKAVAEGDD